MIQFQINGQLYDGFTDMSCKRSMDNFCGEFFFTAVTETQVFANYPIKEGQSCKVFVDGKLWMTASIETAHIDYDDNNMQVQMSGREITADIVDSTVGPNMSIIGPITLENIIKQALSLNNITGISVVNNVSDISEFSADEIIQPPIGMPLYDFLEGYARTRQVLLLTDSLGRVVITRSSQVTSPIKFLNKVSGAQNNINSATGKFDRTKRFNKYNVHSQLNGAEINWYASEFDSSASDESAISVEGNTNQFGVATDPEIRPSRVKHLIAENPMNVQQCQDRADWESNINRARSINYSCSVDGHSMGGTNLDTNILHFIDDDFMGITAEMIVSSVELSSEENGNSALITFAQKDAYLLEATATKKQKNTNILAVRWYQEEFDNLVSGDK